MDYFTFEHESATLPITLTIEVDYSATYREATYHDPSEFSIDWFKYELYCDTLKLTDCINKSSNTKFLDEIDTAIREEISEHFFNNK